MDVHYGFNTTVISKSHTAAVVHVRPVTTDPLHEEYVMSTWGSCIKFQEQVTPNITFVVLLNFSSFYHCQFLHQFWTMVYGPIWFTVNKWASNNKYTCASGISCVRDRVTEMWKESSLLMRGKLQVVFLQTCSCLTQPAISSLKKSRTCLINMLTDSAACSPTPTSLLITVSPQSCWISWGILSLALSLCPYAC